MPIPIENGQKKGYIAYGSKAPSPFPEYYYLYPITAAELVQNKNLKQNEGW